MGNICLGDTARERSLPVLQIREEIVMDLTRQVLSPLDHFMSTKCTLDTQ